MDEKAGIGDIKARVGESFDVMLYSQPASTGFSWYLAYLPRGVVLIDSRIDAIPPILPGSKSRQVFTFLATAPVEDKLSFSLLRPWAPTQPADTRTYHLSVRAAAGLQAELEKTAGSGAFASTQGYRSHLGPVPPYGFPEPGRLHKGPVVHPLYGFPVPFPGGALQMHTVVESAERCVVKYGFPWGVAADAEHCTMEYGFPFAHQTDEKGVVALYGFPRDPTGDCGTPVAIKSDPSHCVVKYGTPTGVATDPAQCSVVYGMVDVRK